MRSASQLVCPRCNQLSGFNYTNRKQTTLMCMNCGFHIHARTFHLDIQRMEARKVEQAEKDSKRAAKQEKLAKMTPEQKAKADERKVKRIARRQKKLDAIKTMAPDKLALFKEELKAKRVARRLKQLEKKAKEPVKPIPKFEIQGWQKNLGDPIEHKVLRQPGTIVQDVMQCRDCHGTGKIEIQDGVRLLTALVRCHKCGGTGKIIRYKKGEEK